MLRVFKKSKTSLSLDSFVQSIHNQGKKTQLVQLYLFQYFLFKLTDAFRAGNEALMKQSNQSVPQASKVTYDKLKEKLLTSHYKEQKNKERKEDRKNVIEILKKDILTNLAFYLDLTRCATLTSEKFFRQLKQIFDLLRFSGEQIKESSQMMTHKSNSKLEACIAQIDYVIGLLNQSSLSDKEKNTPFGRSSQIGFYQQIPDGKLQVGSHFIKSTASSGSKQITDIRQFYNLVKELFVESHVGSQVKILAPVV